MVALYVGGKKVDWADAGKWLTTPTAEREQIELRDDSGELVGRVTIRLVENDPDWVKAITPEEIERALAGPFSTLDEYRKQAGAK